MGVKPVPVEMIIPGATLTMAFSNCDPFTVLEGKTNVVAGGVPVPHEQSVPKTWPMVVPVPVWGFWAKTQCGAADDPCTVEFSKSHAMIAPLNWNEIGTWRKLSPRASIVELSTRSCRVDMMIGVTWQPRYRTYIKDEAEDQSSVPLNAPLVTLSRTIISESLSNSPEALRVQLEKRMFFNWVGLGEMREHPVKVRSM